MKPLISNALMGLLTMCVAVEVAAAEKPRKAAKLERTSSSSASVRTQQRTGDAMAAKTGRPASPDRAPSGSGSSDDLRIALQDVERRLDAEAKRFSAALTQLRDAERAAERTGNAKPAATARKAIDRETSAHVRTRSALLARRDELRRKLGLGPAPEPKDPAPTARGGA